LTKDSSELTKDSKHLFEVGFGHISCDSSQIDDDFVDAQKGLRFKKGTKCFGHFRKEGMK